jgi:hypothetical protein
MESFYRHLKRKSNPCTDDWEDNVDEAVSKYVLDAAENDNLTVHPYELNIISSSNQKNVLKVQRCGPDGCEVHAPAGVNANGVPVSQFLFLDPQRDPGYPFESRFVSFRQASHTPRKYEALVKRREGVEIAEELTADNDTITLRQNGLHHYHRVSGPALAA